ncbi:gamma-glutamylcyclotransferase [Dongia mobilis]|jgi:cation transport protein ChaC|uniref:gamma-glutamylcyclotransferase n=1 Tax=Dongia sp. TaxID=1977262 RepID=UPI0026EBAECE
MPPPTSREMSLTAEMVALCERLVPDPGPRPDLTYLDEAGYLALAREYVQQNGSGPLWVFAYGSLIWNPGFTSVEHQHGIAHGWHRQFSMKLTRWRGTPEQPGLMLALERGGSCDGILFRLPEASTVEELARALQRETDGHEDIAYVRWINVRSGAEIRRALVFWAHPKGFHLPEPPTLDLAAHMLARACGHMGSGAAYLYNTVAKLAEHGIYDRNLWRLQQMVAAEIMAMDNRRA